MSERDNNEISFNVNMSQEQQDRNRERIFGRQYVGRSLITGQSVSGSNGVMLDLARQIAETNRNRNNYTSYPESQGWTPELIREYETYRDERIANQQPVMILQSWIQSRLSEGHYQPAEPTIAPVDQVADELPEEEPMEEVSHEEDALHIALTADLPNFSHDFLQATRVLESRARSREEIQAEFNRTLAEIEQRRAAEQEATPDPEPPTELTELTEPTEQERLSELQAQMETLNVRLVDIADEQSVLEELIADSTGDYATERLIDFESNQSEALELEAMIEELRRQYNELESELREPTGQITADVDGDIGAVTLTGYINPPEPQELPPNVRAGRVEPITPLEGFGITERMGRAVIGTSDFVAQPRGRITAGQITMADLAEPTHTWQTQPQGIRMDNQGIRINTDNFVANSVTAESIRWKPSKRYVFDAEKVNNTVTMLRAFQAILSKYDFSEQDLEKFNIKDLVTEKTPVNLVMSGSTINTANINTTTWV